MSKAMTADQVLAQLMRWHVPYRRTIGWRRRNRNGHGAFGDMHGSLNHHDASAAGGSARNSNRVLKKGRSDLPGPLSHFGVGRNGKVYLIANGRANHAGAVRPQVQHGFLANTEPKQPATTMGETVDGNAFLYGTEVHNSGTGEHYPDAQLLSLILLNAAICDFHKWDRNAVAQHLEVTRRKTDMHPIRGEDSGTWLRREVAVALKAGPGKYTRVGWRPAVPTPPPPPLPDCTHCCPRHCTKP